MKIGTSASKLLKAMQNGVFSGCDEKLIHETQEENRVLENRMRVMREAADEHIDEEVSLNYMALKNFFERNLRIMRCYKFTQMTRIQDDLFRKVEPALSKEFIAFHETLTAACELRYSEFPFLDVCVGDPPLSLYVQILTLEDCGVVMDGDDVIELAKNKLYFLKRRIVDHLINMGLAKVVG